VYFFSTTYKHSSYVGDYCCLAVNSVLKWPNDGTTEYDRSKLPGSHDMGNTDRECHTAGMRYPPQYMDNTRNSVMNANAAR